MLCLSGCEDLRFSAEGKPLAYQIEQWDAAAGTASIWVRVPTIKGNARQAIRLHWGKTDVASESNGSAVFNAANGFLAVWHMTEPVKDDVGTLESKDLGTTPTPGMIGPARSASEGGAQTDRDIQRCIHVRPMAMGTADAVAMDARGLQRSGWWRCSSRSAKGHEKLHRVRQAEP